MADKKQVKPSAPVQLLEFALTAGDARTTIKAATVDTAIEKAKATSGATRLVARRDGKTVWKSE